MEYMQTNKPANLDVCSSQCHGVIVIILNWCKTFVAIARPCCLVRYFGYRIYNTILETAIENQQSEHIK